MAPVEAACAQPRMFGPVEMKVLSAPPKAMNGFMVRPLSQSETKMVSFSRPVSSSTPSRSMLMEEPLLRSSAIPDRIRAIEAV